MAVTAQAAPLPAERVLGGDSFDVITIDVAVPPFCQGQDSTHKAHIYIDTCALTRTLILEFLSDLPGSTFLVELKPFFTRRGIAHTVFSASALMYKHD